MDAPPDAKMASYIELAESGDVKAQIFVANAYLHGKVVDKDESKTAYWFGRAEARGSSIASFRLAFLLLHRGQENGFNKLYTLRDRGFAPAFYELGNCFYTGMYVDRDPDKARAEWQKAANAGHILARIKVNKFKQERSKTILKLIYFLKSFFYTAQAMFVIAKGKDDVGILGHLK